ncbi:BgTH12-02031 [Blumeria graminis f. sp. triticale]|uniref:Bgt-3904 n=3 Tax=Blumeria graminis TaxID=34373 RepID=A0A381L999_BLUGR|nr:hypothetical protein BGT96224_3904 [Blumeria graminis f. sp. tritici 96224]CAD6501782.1 BgTH12-02031 [Blumeria graminis f. sp. triticale]VDB84427.1 Bgt-3904 [Blumeria graminis f. sp. tritici]
MAKGARSSTRKANNVRLKTKVFGPTENARTERLSEKLQKLASLPKPTQDIIMTIDPETSDYLKEQLCEERKQDEVMEIDNLPFIAGKQHKSTGKNKVEKKRFKRKTSIVFPKYNREKTNSKKTKK